MIHTGKYREILVPLVLHHWALNQDPKECVLAHHILNAFSHDKMSGFHSDKHAAEILINVEAAIRAVVGTQHFELSSLFPGARMHPMLKHEIMSVVPPDFSKGKRNKHLPLVATVDDLLKDRATVWTCLQQGRIVVSNLHGEGPMECVSPMWKASSQKMVIVATQVRRTCTCTRRARTVSLHADLM